ncbi:SGNH/GDSL hydrolase family protein [uncultured Sphingomonas sp.]|uniref:SGNH/GDSL hydrolase family protein n=1 Tax=uncultured Sphingomonas sp. TaxID=158754 RepID=UPI0035C99845
MTYGRIMKWGALGSVGAVVAVVAGYFYQVRKPPAANSWYVALGSSYAAGLGLGPRAPGSPVVSRRSINGYPQQLARLLRVPSFTDMTSSGSTVRHVMYGGQMMLGPQIDALGPETRLVTLTAGGNDVGYIGDLTAMAYRNGGGVLGAAIGAFWKGAKPVAERDFVSLDEKLRATLRKIARRSPHARIVVVTYPTILPGQGTCPSIGLTEEQAALMRTVGEKLAQTTRAVGTGATIVDMAVLSAGHDACSKAPWVNGFEPETGASFHPTLQGARATAKAIKNVVGSVSPTAAAGLH